jgi:anti-sigma-K factor RskA
VTIDNDKIQDLLIGEAFGTLDKADAQELRELLMKHPELRAELENWRETAALVALDTPLLEPSDDVRESLLKQVWFDKKDREKMVEDSAPIVNVESSTESVAVNKEIEEKSNVVQFPKRKKWWLVPEVLAYAATFFIVAFLGLYSLKATSDLQTSNEEIAVLRQKLNATQSNLDATQGDLANARELLTTNSTIVTLAGLKDAPAAKAKLIFDQKSGKAVLVFEGLPQAPSGKAYQLWVIAGSNAPVSGGVFKTDSNGRGELTSEVPQTGREKGVFAVTLEPEDGVPAPTGSMFLKS